MATVPKWQEPLVERAATAEKTLRAVMHAPGGGAGAFAAAAAADQDLAELCRAVAARSGSPLLQQLLMHGARALDAHAGVLLASTVDPDELVVPVAPAELDEDQADDVEQPVERPAPPVTPPSLVGLVIDEDQALVEQGSEPAGTSGDAQANAPVVEQAQASLDGVVYGYAVPVDEGQALVEPVPIPVETSGDAPANEPMQDSFDRAAPLGWGKADAVEAWTTDHGKASDFKVAPATKRRWQDMLDVVAVMVDHVRTDSAYFHARRNSGVPHARQAARDAISGIDRCVSELHQLRAELVTTVDKFDAADRGGAP